MLSASRPSAARFRLPSFEASTVACESRGVRTGKACASFVLAKSSGVMYIVLSLRLVAGPPSCVWEAEKDLSGSQDTGS